MAVRIAIGSLLLCALLAGLVLQAHTDTPASPAPPSLREGPGTPATDEMVDQVFQANSFWLHPPVGALSYTYQMKHVENEDTWGASVEFTAPGNLSLAIVGGRSFDGQIDDSYDPGNSAYPPKLTTILQGVTFFGPMHEWRLKREGVDVTVVGEDKIGEREVTICQLRPTAEPSPEAVQQWEARLRRQATRPKHLYEFVPVEKEINGHKQVVIELTCVKEPGPTWQALVDALKASPGELRCQGVGLLADVRDYRGEKRPVIVMGRDPEFQGQSPFTATIFYSGVNNMTTHMALGEGEEVFDQAEYDRLLAESDKPSSWLPMRIGCGIWGCWYGYSGGGAQVDQVWVDKQTGMVLREEGFARGQCRFTVDYRDFEALPGGGLAPLWVRASLLSAPEPPWVFEMRFDTLEGKAWLLESLEERTGDVLTTTAKVTDAFCEPLEE